MYCIRCGRQLQDGVKYCIFCGSPTAEERKAQSVKKQDTASIPMDFFSSRINPEQEDLFDITIPEDFIQDTPEKQAQQPDAVKIPAVGAEDIQTPQGIEDDAYTRMISKEELQAARTAAVQQDNDIEEKTEMADAPQSVDVTDIPDSSEIVKLPESPDRTEQSPDRTELSDIPDIPIPQDFITAEPESEVQGYMQTNPVYRKNTVRQRSVYAQQETDEEPEQLISKRGILVVVLVVIFFFAIAVGACVMALQGGEPEATGSAVSDINFSYEESNG